MNKPFASLVLMLLIGPLSFGQQPRLVLPIGHSQAQEPKLVIPVGHMSEITSVQFSSTGKWIATGSYDNTAKIWEMETGRLLNTLEGIYF